MPPLLFPECTTIDERRPARTVRTAFLIPPETYELIYGDESAERLGAISELRMCPPEAFATSPVLLPDWIKDVEVAFTGWHSPRFDAALLARMPKLRAVFHAGGTIRPQVSDAFWDRGITITSAASANAIPVAEFTLGLMLLGLKRAWALSREMKERRGFAVAHPAVPGALQSVVGIVSLGHIGRLVRERLRPFGVRVIAYDPYLPRAVFEELDVESVTLPELMRLSDVISLHAPLNMQTRGLVGRELFELMKPNATFVNTARGGVVDQAALIEFLRVRTDVQALLDVTDPMPAEPTSALFDLPNVFLTPHIAGSLGRECRRMGQLAINEFERHLAGLPPLYPVTREQAAMQT